jgi:alkylation response protein AidB-like acyl-CoA dehydrogenase
MPSLYHLWRIEPDSAQHPGQKCVGLAFMSTATSIQSALVQTSLSEERLTQLNMLRDSAAEFVRRNIDFKKYRERREQLPGYDTKHLKQMAEMGWFGLLVPEAQGGLGLGLAEMAMVMQELGRGLMAEPLVASTVLVGRVLARAEPSSISQRLLAGMVDASALPALAWQEGLGALDAMAMSTNATATAQGVQLSGTKRFVAGAAGASGFLVSALHESSLGLYWVPTKTAGASLSFEWRADGTPVGVLSLDGVRVPNEHILSKPGMGTLANLEWAIDEAAVMASSEMLGVMEAALQMALSYLRTRVQFGKPIASFQALQHKATDLYVQQELCRAVLAETVSTLSKEGDAIERLLIASRCKSRCSDAALRITREVIQLHGAIGFTDEYDVGLYLKRALVLSAWLGNSSTHRRRFAAHSPVISKES